MIKAYISASRRALSVIAKAETEAWQTTCSYLSPKSNPKSVHSLLCSVADSSSLLLTSLTVLLPVNRLWYLPISRDPTYPFLSQRPCVAEPEATSPSFSEPHALRSLTHTSVLPSLLLNFFAAASNLSFTPATGPDKVAYPMLKYLPRAGMDFLFNRSWTLRSFPLHRRHLPLFPSTR